jgi:hypothetical protein
MGIATRSKIELSFSSAKECNESKARGTKQIFALEM